MHDGDRRGKGMGAAVRTDGATEVPCNVTIERREHAGVFLRADGFDLSVRVGAG